jgi:hypothetical protein
LVLKVQGSGSIVFQDGSEVTYAGYFECREAATLEGDLAVIGGVKRGLGVSGVLDLFAPEGPEIEVIVITLIGCDL